jgi:hypothetical protein
MPYPIKAVSFTKVETTGAVTEIQAVYDKEGKKPKTYIQWVPEGSPRAEVRIYTALFKSDQSRVCAWWVHERHSPRKRDHLAGCSDRNRVLRGASAGSLA